MNDAELEIAIHRRDIESYSLDLRFTAPGDDADIRVTRDDLIPVQFHFSDLLAHALDPRAYGQLLAANLFADSSVRQIFAQAYAVAHSRDTPLRIRLYLAQSALELHSLRWETLCHPEDGTPLLTRSDIVFSRYLASRDWRPVRTRSHGQLRVLAVVANPQNLVDYSLAPIDADAVLAPIRAAVGTLTLTELTAFGQVSLANIAAQLLAGVDILYLTCHARLEKGESWLFLQNDEGQVERIPGSALAAHIRDGVQRPRLLVLAACQTAGDGVSGASANALVALGPRLAEAGIPAVLALNGNMSMASVAQFMPAFFHELLHEGKVDRAVAVARGVVRDQPDSWMPVLFMRLRNGQLWYAPSFADNLPGAERRGRAAERWPVIMQNIRNEVCTPIIGPDMAESIFGTRQDIAWRLANDFHFPMDPHDREGLPQVAQFLAVNQDPSFLPSKLVRYLVQGIRNRHDALPPELNEVTFDEQTPTKELILILDRLITLAWRQRRSRLAAEPFSIVANLPIPVWITTDHSNLLATALREAGKEPQVCLCPWNDYLLQKADLVKVWSEPDVQHPLVYHLFGNLQEPRSLVLTEDDFFDYLIGVTRNNEQIPSIIRERLADSSLLFLGFRMEDWQFRVIFRTLMDTLSARRRRHYTHVAVQIAPEEDRLLDPQRARRYLEQYFQSADISIYWGSAEDFAQEFDRQWRGRP